MATRNIGSSLSLLGSVCTGSLSELSVFGTAACQMINPHKQA